ncbi:MAG: ATP phosphoribosyltransferase [Flavobacteriaceae bacterium]|jgi:ATP phosphoribosyltransferase|nr:ATP phosphoribosyltransferase [Flavobacteriaceae bacterium]
MKKTMRLALQKSGRLHEDSMQLLRDCGISIDNGSDQLKASARNFDLEVFFLRNGDIPQYLKDGVVDAAIIGDNLLVEKAPDLAVVEKLGFSRCKVCLAIPKDKPYHGIADFQGQKIATSYPNTVQRFLEKNQIQAELHIINGSVEIAPNIGLSDSICDIVSSGSTLFKNNLKPVETLLHSEAVLVVSPQINPEVTQTIEVLRTRIRAVLKGRSARYVLLNAPNDKIAEIARLLPGMKSPTVLPLAEPGWSSVHSVIDQDSYWEVIDALKAAGAEGILVIPIEKMFL